jgi:hypothetical protein
MAEFPIGGLTPEQRDDLGEALTRAGIAASWLDGTLSVDDRDAPEVRGYLDGVRRGALSGAAPFGLPPPSGPPLSGPAPAPFAAPPGAGPGGFGGPAGSGGYGGAGGYGGYGYGGYGGAPYPVAPVRRTNGLATTSFILSLLGIAFCGLLGIGGLITGYKARRRIRETGEDGAGLALAGIIIGWVTVGITSLIMLFYAGFFIVLANTPSTTSTRTPSTYTVPTTTATLPRTPGTQLPSGVVPVEACPRVQRAMTNLGSARPTDRGIVTDAAATLHQYLPASWSDDIDTVLADSLTRVGVPNPGQQSGDVQAAVGRLAAVVSDACPS